MEWQHAISTSASSAKAALFWSAKRWAAEADRRAAIRLTTGPKVIEASEIYRALKGADKGETSPATAKALGKLRAAKRAHPDSMLWLSTKVASGVGLIGWFGAPAVPVLDWLYIGIGVVAAIVGTVAVLAAVGKTKPDALKPTKQEAALLKRLDPKHWAAHRDERGLKDTITGVARVTNAGLVCPIRLDGTWTVAKLRGSLDNVRTLLGASTDLRVQVKDGKTAEWAKLVLRTRSAAAGTDLTWSLENSSFGVDTVSGDDVAIPLGERMLFAGRSGAGKSVATRPLLWLASEGETDALVIIDFKKIEGRLWDHRARVESDAEGVLALVDELVAEQTYRLDVLPKGQDKWVPTVEHPRITVLVDEGAEVMTSGKVVTYEEDDNGRAHKVTRTSLTGLESLARMGRAAAIDIVWCTQKPSIDDGIPKQVAPQLSRRVCLAVSTPTEARVVLGEDAQAKGWHADALDAPGFAMIRDGKRGPDPVQVRYMDAKQVIALPDKPIWHGQAGVSQPPTDGPTTPPVKVPEQTLNGSEAKVLAFVRSAGAPVRQADIVEGTGAAKGTVSKAIAKLVDAGRVVRLADGAVGVTA